MPFYLDLSLRLLVALLLGGIIGVEREYRSKEAGFRTHFLVAMGSALFCIVGQYGFGADLKDSSRVAAQVVSGIGFLGAGTIIFQKNVVRGLTTAAGLWVTAAIGLACGTGMYATAAIATVLILLGLEVINSFIPVFGTINVHLSFKARNKEMVQRVVGQLKSGWVELYSYELREHRDTDALIFIVNMEMKVKRRRHIERILEFMNEFEDVTVSCVE